MPSQPSRVIAMFTRSCGACGKLFFPRPQIPNQQFCSDHECQRERRRRTQAERRANNSATRMNDTQYCRDWRIKNPDYWKRYRATHPEYTERNRIQQRQRNKLRKTSDRPGSAVESPSAARRSVFPNQVNRISMGHKKSCFQVKNIVLNCLGFSRSQIKRPTVLVGP